MMSESCPTSNTLFIAAALIALLGAFVAGMVGHGALRPLLEARGVSPWRVRDSLGSLPLVLIGSALLCGVSAWVVVSIAMSCTVTTPTVVGLAIVASASYVMIRLGLRALGKLV